MLDNSFVRGLRGPVGSGKSVGCCMELFRRACQQEPDDAGIRRTRWAVVRNSYPELRTTTMKTWEDWFPPSEFGPIRMHPTPYVHHIKVGDIDMEVLFVALDRPDDVKKLLSMELTGAFVNEAREVSKTLIDALTMRVGRYPSRRIGGPTWYGVIMDTNAPDEDHWWPIMSGETPLPDWMSQDDRLMMQKPDNWHFYTQPPGMLEVKKDGQVVGYEPNPEAENVANLPPEYYPTIIQGKDAGWIKVYVLNRLGMVSEGRVIYPEFRRELHVAKDALACPEGNVLGVGVDFGLTPAAVIGYRLRRSLVVVGEIVSSDTSTQEFARVLKSHMFQHFPGHKFNVWGDPSGDFRAQTDKNTPFRIMRANGIECFPAPSNDPIIRIDAVKGALTRLDDGQPSLIIDPSCRNLIKGFEDAYCYRRLQVSGERYADQPDKNRFSHVHDAMQYLALGLGEGRELLGHNSKDEVTKAPRRFSVFDRAKPETDRKPRLRFGRF